MQAALPYSKAIENRIRKLMRDGVNIYVIFDSIQDLQNAPKSSATFYKLYGHVMAQERAEFASYLGDKARQRIEEGSDRILELALKSKAGWTPSEEIEIKVEGDSLEQQSALKTLMRKLGKEVDEDE